MASTLNNEQVYNAKQDTIQGDRIMLYVEKRIDGLSDGSAPATDLFPIAFGTSCSVEISADTIDTSNKMGGNWKNTLAGQLGWTVSCDALLSKASGHMSFETLKQIMAARRPIVVILGKVADTDEEFQQAAEAGYALEESDTVYVRGSAVITQLSLNAGGGSEIASCSITLTGDGALSESTPAA
ncbi:MAG: hypothetical protein IJN55_08160 [Alistipes sp.]|nr:hypothetical protein [Alistipes sp.]